ncbi:hypothetical protein SAMN05428975_4383 [Mucilaginibacter sp. OK268]|jgi:hypothetical protein|uniref:hypothetical protein n=1 Tax=Mucilaginibacter sp. OK268 TaxID=1881048 RepID=UPI00087FFF32|nr:hypothetical protein [Mucilaginibacter sp. OK268]SDP97004.1 hypothetical protein SAMN05428975_4383 [Mucilaginibacter sp. OK268]
MNTISTDSQLEYELQELYILSQHWLQDLSFLEDEMQFFKNILCKYQETGTLNEIPSKAQDFTTKIREQEQHLDSLKRKVPEFLVFLKPFIGDQKKEMDLSFLEKYNKPETELRTLFAAIKATKQELFSYTEAIMTTEKAVQTR